MLRISGLLLAALVSLCGNVAPAAAQTWPTKPVHLVAPYAPGGIADIAGRLIGQKLTEAWGQQVVVENRPGGNGFIGVTAVTKATPDGYMLLVGTAGDFTINPALFKDIPYDVARDLVPITMLSDTPTVLAVHGEAPYKSVADVIADAKARPGKVAIATPGNGSINQLVFEWMGLGTGTKYQHIPYKGGAPAATALAAGDIPLGVLAISSVLPHLKSGRIRVLAVTTAKRSPFNPEWPTLQESGVPDIDISNWTALMAPKGTPQSVIDKIHAEITNVLGMADIKDRFAGGGAVVVPTSAAELDARIKRDAASFKTIVEKAKIQVD